MFVCFKCSYIVNSIEESPSRQEDKLTSIEEKVKACQHDSESDFEDYSEESESKSSNQSHDKNNLSKFLFLNILCIIFFLFCFI